MEEEQFTYNLSHRDSINPSWIESDAPPNTKTPFSIWNVQLLKGACIATTPHCWSIPLPFLALRPGGMSLYLPVAWLHVLRCCPTCGSFLVPLTAKGVHLNGSPPLLVLRHVLSRRWVTPSSAFFPKGNCLHPTSGGAAQIWEAVNPRLGLLSFLLSNSGTLPLFLTRSLKKTINVRCASFASSTVISMRGSGSL